MSEQNPYETPRETGAPDKARLPTPLAGAWRYFVQLSLAVLALCTGLLILYIVIGLIAAAIP